MLKNLLTASLIAIASPAFALLPQFYIGFGAGSGKLYQKTTHSGQDVYSGGSLRGALNYHAGVMLTDHFGLEIGQSYIYNDTFSDSGWNIEYKNNRVSYLAAKGAISLTPLFTAYGKLGAAYVKSDSVSATILVLNPQFKEHNGLRPYGAVGASVIFSPMFSAYLEFSGVPKIGNVPGNATGMIGLDVSFPTV